MKPWGEPLSEAKARQLALQCLGRREYGCRELKERLGRRGVEAALAGAIVDELKSQGLVSDTRFAEAFVRSKANRLFGPLKIGAQLRQRGLQKDVIAEAMSPYRDCWFDSAANWVRKKAGPVRNRKEKARLYRSGMNRGFTHEQMMQALDRLQDMNEITRD